MLKFSYIYMYYIHLTLSITRIRRVVILEEFLAVRPYHHQQRITFLEVAVLVDIILPLIDLCFWVWLTYCCRSKSAGEQRQATRGAGRLPGLLVGPGPRSTTRDQAHALAWSR
jgi:hypothetical protein